MDWDIFNNLGVIIFGSGGMIISGLVYCCYRIIQNNYDNNDNDNDNDNDNEDELLYIIIEHKYIIPITENILNNNLNNYYLQKDNENICVICLDYLKKNELITELECTHVYHKKCLFQWFNEKKYHCPICRDEIFENIV